MAFKVSADIAKAAIAAGCTKCNMTWTRLLVLGFLAGAYIAFGALFVHWKLHVCAVKRYSMARLASRA